MCGRFGERRRTARRAHDERLGKTGPGAPHRERSQVPRRDGPKVGVEDGRRGTLVLAKLRRTLVRRDDVRIREAAAQLIRDEALVRRISKREQEAHRDRFCLDVRHRLDVNLGQDALGPIRSATP